MWLCRASLSPLVPSCKTPFGCPLRQWVGIAFPLKKKRRDEDDGRDGSRARKKRKTVRANEGHERQQSRVEGNQAETTKEHGYFDLGKGTCQWTSSWETEKKVSEKSKEANVYQASLTIRFRLVEPSRRAEYRDTNKPTRRGGEDRYRDRKVQHISLVEFINQGERREESPCHKFVRDLSVQQMIVCASPSLNG